MHSTSVYDFQAVDIQGKERSLADYRGQVLLIVNTASKCGFTPQFEGLQSLYSDLSDKGLTVLGFPCNQFLSQEPGDEQEIGQFCSMNYGVDFPMFSKIDVNGDNAHPLFNYLKKEARGLMGSEKIKWNFTKFLVNRQGKVVARYAPQTKPEEIRKDIEALL
ncbi:MAG: glutathione peroxidase [Pseudomonadota bacterium]|nr:glutathione peroxidase [Pseudomonadota bacterium]